MKIDLPETRCGHFGNICQCVFERVDMQYKIREELFELEWVAMTIPSGGWVEQGSNEKPYISRHSVRAWQKIYTRQRSRI